MMPIPRGIPKICFALDLLVVVALLGSVLIVPIFFMVPYNDEWLRLNYLSSHSVWQWTVMHAETWVVRPTGELILGLEALPNTRPALAQDFTPETFLARFHAVYVGNALAYCALLYVNAAILARSWRALPHFLLLLFGLLTCWLLSSELEYAFYWSDGYANILVPFTLCCCGLPLLMRPHRLAVAGGALFVLAGALGHEVVAIYTLGFLLLALAFRRPEARPWHMRALWAALFVVLLALVLWQLFGEGPMIRNDQYLRTVGKRYDLESAWLNVKAIHPLRAPLSVISAPLAISIYRDWLGILPARAAEDMRRQRWFWISLALGTLTTSLLPLFSVGLKKGRLAISYYSVSTHLFFGLLGVLFYPFMSDLLERALGTYRRKLGSIIPIAIVLGLASGNITEFRAVLDKYRPLRAEAHDYMRALFDAPRDRRLQICRPKHPYSKPGRKLTDHSEEEYFGIASVRNRCANR